MAISLYVLKNDLYSEKVRMVFLEKRIIHDLIVLDNLKEMNEYTKLDNYNSLPIIIDRHDVIDDSYIICQYLEEKYPYPHLLPVESVGKTNTKLLINRIEKDIFQNYNILAQKNTKIIKKEASDKILNIFKNIEHIFSQYKFFMSDNMSLIDVSFTLLLWKMQAMKIDYSSIIPVYEYAQRMFENENFEETLIYPTKSKYLKI